MDYRFPYFDAQKAWDLEEAFEETLTTFLGGLPGGERGFLNSVCYETTKTVSLYWDKVTALAEALHSLGQLDEPEIQAIWKEST